MALILVASLSQSHLDMWPYFPSFSGNYDRKVSNSNELRYMRMHSKTSGALCQVFNSTKDKMTSLRI